MKRLFLRYWINQPSRLQPDHALHGKNVYIDDEDWPDRKSNCTIRVWIVDKEITETKQLSEYFGNFHEEHTITNWILSGKMQSAMVNSKLSLALGWTKPDSLYGEGHH